MFLPNFSHSLSAILCLVLCVFQVLRIRPTSSPEKMDFTNPNLLHNLSELCKLMQQDENGDHQTNPVSGHGPPASIADSLASDYAMSASGPSSPSSPSLGNKMCAFCKRNGETSTVYTSHNLRERGKVTCPILWKHSCELCGATGDKAHTRSYCLLAASQRSLQQDAPNNHFYYNSVVLKQSGRNSFGKINRKPRHNSS
jgi:hypothetical protein